MIPKQMNSPDEQEETEPPGETGESTRDQALAQSGPRLMRMFFIFAALNIAGLVWLGIRSDSPASLRGSLDVLFQLVIAGGIGFFAFRALVAYPFQLTDLFAMVLVLGVWLRFTVESIQTLSSIGFLPPLDSEAKFGQILQAGLLSTSVLVAGGAFGLWACHKLNIKSVVGRLFTIIPAMLALPAAAGCAAFLVVALQEFSMESDSSQSVAVLMLCWFGSVILTFINAATFIRTLALRAEIKEDSVQM